MNFISNKFLFSAILALSCISLFTACDNEIDLDNGNVSQKELNREKYQGIKMEFWSGDEAHWEEGLWGEGAAMTGQITAFRINFPKCKTLYATVPMLKDVEITANGIICSLKDMLADRYDEDIYLKSVTLTDLKGNYTMPAENLQYEWNNVTFGRYMKISYSQFDYYFPSNPSNSPRYFTLHVSYKGEYPSPDNQETTYTPDFDLIFRQLGNSNHVHDLH